MMISKLISDSFFADVAPVIFLNLLFYKNIVCFLFDIDSHIVSVTVFVFRQHMVISGILFVSRKCQLKLIAQLNL